MGAGARCLEARSLLCDVNFPRAVVCEPDAEVLELLDDLNVATTSDRKLESPSRRLADAEDDAPLVTPRVVTPLDLQVCVL